MVTNDMCDDIAALLLPLPEDRADEPAENSDLAADAILGERETTAESLRIAWSAGNEDPLLTTLAYLQQRRLQLESQMRQLIAYGRRFTRPRPYKLIDLANAAGMSISGVRTAYEDEEIDQVAEALGRPPAVEPGGSTGGK
jgi:hypothetical protein